jgi:hypothetical protein
MGNTAMKTLAVVGIPFTAGASMALYTKSGERLSDKTGLTQFEEAKMTPARTLSEDEQKTEFENTKSAERRRRQLIASQNSLVKTSALGASIKDQLLGGRVTLSGS